MAATASLLGGTRVNVLGGLMTAILQVVAVPMALAASAPAEYGVWVALYSVTQVLVVSDLGIGASLVRKAGRVGIGGARGIESASRFAYVAIVLISCIVLGVITVSLSGRLADAVGQTIYVMLSVLAFVSLAVGVAGRAASSVLIGLGRFDLNRGLSLSGAILRIGVLVAAVQLDLGIVAVAMSDCLAICVTGFASPLALRIVAPQAETRAFRQSWRTSLAETKRVLVEGFPFFLLSFSGSLVIQGLPIIVAALGSPSDAGVFAVLYRVALSGRQVLNWVWMPAFSSLSRSLDAEPDVRHSLIRSSSWMHVAVGVLAFVPLGIFSEDILRVVFGSDFANAAREMAGIFAYLCIMATVLPGIAVSNADGRLRALMFAQISWTAVSLSISALLVHEVGRSGAVIGTLGTALVALPIMLILTSNVSRFPKRLIAVPSVLAFVSAGFAASSAHFVRGVLSGSLGSMGSLAAALATYFMLLGVVVLIARHAFRFGRFVIH